MIVGGRGNGTVIASTIEDLRKSGESMECVGFLNDNEKEINGYPVLGGIQSFKLGDWPETHQFIYAMSNVKQAEERYAMLLKLGIPENRFATLVHPTAVVSDQARLSPGVVVMPLALVGPNAIIGAHTQLYAQSFVGHDSQVEEMVFVANNASIGGRIHIETGAHIGSNSSLRERIRIGQFAIIGLGSVVLKDVEARQIVAGVPAKLIGRVS